MDFSFEGKTLGQYTILNEIGRGGMGIVYRAENTDLKRLAALKVLPWQVARDEAFLKRFQREARAAAQLNHPNAVLIYNTGQEGDVHYIAMEFVDGHDLQSELNESEPMDLRRALDVTRQVARALRAAHAKGIIHRDIKPQNIMIDREGTVKVMDFGIAQVSMEVTALTVEGMALGTPNYMSPEQCKGQQVDHRSDFYSLGVVLYRMLAGRVPFEATTPFMVMQQVVTEPVPSISEFNPGVPETVVGILDRLLAKKADERYPDAQAIIEDIDLVLESGVRRLSAEEYERLVGDAQSSRPAGEVSGREGAEATQAMPVEGEDTTEEPTEPEPGSDGGAAAGGDTEYEGATVLIDTGERQAREAAARAGAEAAEAAGDSGESTLSTQAPEDGDEGGGEAEADAGAEGAETEEDESPTPLRPGAGGPESRPFKTTGGRGEAAEEEAASAGAPAATLTVGQATTEKDLTAVTPPDEDASSGSRVAVEPPEDRPEQEAGVAAEEESEPERKPVGAEAKSAEVGAVGDEPVKGGDVRQTGGRTQVPGLGQQSAPWQLPWPLPKPVLAGIGAGVVLLVIVVAVLVGGGEEPGPRPTPTPTVTPSPEPTQLVDEPTPTVAVTPTVAPTPEPLTIEWAAVGQRVAAAIMSIDPDRLRYALHDSAEPAAADEPANALAQELLTDWALLDATRELPRVMARRPVSLEDRLMAVLRRHHRDPAVTPKLLQDVTRLMREGEEAQREEVLAWLARLESGDLTASGFAEWWNDDPFDLEEPAPTPTATPKPPPTESALSRTTRLLAEAQAEYEQAKAADADPSRSAAEKLALWRKVVSNQYAASAARTHALRRIAFLDPQTGLVRRVELGGGLSMDFVYIGPGRFTMGSATGDADERPPTQVTLSEPFWIARTEVTKQQWALIMGGSAPPGEATHPATDLSWFEAKEFCDKLAGRIGMPIRLPTEAEWEYACKAGTESDYFFDLPDWGTYARPSGRTMPVFPVGEKASNPWRLYDMVGNVWEWCADYYAPRLPGGEVANPTGPPSGSERVIRGGSLHERPYVPRSSERRGLDPNTRAPNVGLRICYTASVGE